MRKLTKTLMWALVGIGIGYFLTQNNESMRIAMMIGMAGFPAGWRVVSKWGFIPYMYSFVEMKPSALKRIVNVVTREYVFRDNTDFILNYYIPLHDNFGISNGGISALIRKAEKRTNQNKILNNLDEKLGLKRKGKTSIGAEILHGLIYWPLFALYFMFEVSKIVFTNLYEFLIPVFLIVFIGYFLKYGEWKICLYLDIYFGK